MKRLLALALLITWLGWAQTPVNVLQRAPDCSIYFTLTAASPTSVVFDNRQAACTSWTITYLNVSGTFAALSLLVQDSADVTPRVWVAFAGALISGVNPNIALTQATTTFFGYVPWIRVNATVVGAGTITGRLYGFRQNSVTLFANAITVTSSGYVGCTSSLPFTLAGAGYTQIVPLVAGQVIQVCHIDWATAAAEDFYLGYGTGVNCAGGPAALTGTYPNILTAALDLFGSVITPAAQALCLHQSVAQATGGLVTFSQHP
jgi:hypothetical protein